MRDKIQARIAELNAKYEKVPLAGVVPLYGDSTNDFWRGVTKILETKPTGKYRVANVYYLDPGDFVPSDLDDSLIDAEYDKADKIIAELAPGTAWIIPVGDPLGLNEDDEDQQALILTGE